MEPTDLVPHDRRSFLTQLGKTLSVGLGLGLVAATSAKGRTACAITCSPLQSCSTACCSNPPCTLHLFHCTTNCGYSFNKCLAHSCTTYCYSNVC